MGDHGVGQEGAEDGGAERCGADRNFPLFIQILVLSALLEYFAFDHWVLSRHERSQGSSEMKR